jgi:hypothetical protein
MIKIPAIMKQRFERKLKGSAQNVVSTRSQYWSRGANKSMMTALSEFVVSI